MRLQHPTHIDIIGEIMDRAAYSISVSHTEGAVDIEIKIPSLGESESEALLAQWLVEVGDQVAVDDVLAEIESDKVSMEITAVEAGVIREIRKPAGSTVEPGEIIGVMEAGTESTSENTAPEPSEETRPAEPTTSEASGMEPSTPKKDSAPPPAETIDEGRRSTRRPMSPLRRRIAARLKESQQTAATLTTFNEIDMHSVLELRRRHQDDFRERHGVKLGIMSFFVRACALAMRRFPIVNAAIDGEDIVYHNYLDIGIAVSTDKGLMVPILRDAGMMSFAEIEKGIASLAERARKQELLPQDFTGGTFTITNGGVFGSLLSTPILNPPQSAILGMHTIQPRPVALDGEVAIRPMMYVALSYDHRLIDGREAVGFLREVKAFVEQPMLGLLE